MDNDEETLGPEPQCDTVQNISEAESHVPEQLPDVGTIMNGNAHGHAESKHDDPTQTEPVGCESESAEVIKETATEDEQLDLTPELQEGLKILNYFLADKKSEPFRDEVFNQLSEAEIEKYKKEISEPMCLLRMKEKFQTGEYESITQVVNDFNLMIYNCQRFNGTNHPVSKKAAKMSIVLKQKLKLLRQDIRSKIAQDGSVPWMKQENQDSSFGSGFRKRTANHLLDDSSEMMNQLRIVEEQKAKEERRQKKEEHRAAQAAAERELIDWEEENVTVEPIKSVIQHSWELPQIGLFLYLCRDALQLEEVPMYELERCLAMPRQSKRLQQVMTALLSTPFQREKRAEKSMPDMPYSLWSRKLTEMVDAWYKELNTCHGDVFFAACRLGLVEQMFEVLGSKNPLREKPFHSLSFYKRVWILKSVCDYLVEKEENLRNAIESQDSMDQRGLMLGSDRHGNQYIHFTQFCGPNLRIYRQRKPPVPVVKEEEEEEEDEEEEKPRVKPVKGKSSAKRKLNLDGSNAKRSRSATPLNDSETDGTVSPAPSDIRSKSRASSSRHSSPLPREANGRSRQTSARNSPAPDSSSVDSFSINAPFGKGRKTRNSAETIFFENIENLDLERLLRQRNRRSRGAKNAAKETADAESVSTVGDESSQDGLRADTPSSTSALEGEVKTEVELVNGKLSTENEENTWTPSQVKSESQDSFDADSVRKATHSSHVRALKGGGTDAASREVHIKSEPVGCKCDTESEVHTGSGTECDRLIESCDIKLDADVKKEGDCPTSVSVDTAMVGGVPAAEGSNLKPPTTCDIKGQSAAPGNPSNSQLPLLPVSTSALFPSAAMEVSAVCVKKESNADDSGFVSFQTSPHVTGSASAVCDDEDNKRIPGREEMSGGVGSGGRTGDSDGGGVTAIKEENSVKEVKCGEEHSAEGTLVKMEDACAQNEDSVGSSQYGGAFNSKDNQDNGRQTVVSKALLDHVDYSEEEMVPDPGEFELIVEDMEGLDRLIKQFEPEQVESSPQISPGARAAKRQKSRSTPKAGKRWVCEKELYERLVAMQTELQPFRSKLALLTKKARLKMQKEFQSFIDETPKVEDLQAWETESDSEQNSDESGVEESQSGKDSDESEEVSNDTSSASAPPKVNNIPSKPSSTASVESPEVDRRDIEEYEADVSSRGRLRKRRLIPNNVEDQGLKKKKMMKKPEESPPVSSSSQVSNLVCKSEDGTIKLNISNSQFLAMVEQGGSATSELVQQLAAAKFPSGQTLGWKPQGIKVIGGPIPHSSGDGSGALHKASTTQASAHPVMQQILSAQTPGNVRQIGGLPVQRKKGEGALTSTAGGGGGGGGVSSQSMAVTSVVVTSSATSVSRAAGSGAAAAAGLNLQSPLLMAASMKGGKQQVYVVTPEQQEELLRRGILRSEHRQVVQAVNSAVRPQVVTCGSDSVASSSSASSLSSLASGIRQLTAVQQVLQPQTQTQAILQGQPDILAAAASATATSRPVQSPGPVPGQVVVGTPVAGGKMQGPVTAVKIVPSSNGQERLGVPVVVGQVLSQPKPGVKTPVVVNNAGGSRTLIVQSGRSIPRYAGNVTVKELLESRAANKSDDCEVPKMTDSSQNKLANIQPHGRIVVTTASLPVTSPLSVMTTRVQKTAPSPTPSLVQRLVPGMVQRPGQSSLDDALQTVVTSYHTTLPTADIKIPSPTTLPSLSPRKDITRIVRSTKAPIPTTTRVQAKHSSVVLASTLLSGSSALPTGNRAISGMVPAGTVVRPGTMVLPAGQALAGVNMSGKEQIVVQVIPRGTGGVGGSVQQRYVLPQAGSVLQLANVKGVAAGSGVQEGGCAVPVVYSQAQGTVASTTSIVTSGISTLGLQQLSHQSSQRVLMTPSFSSAAGAASTTPAAAAAGVTFPPSAAITKNTSEVLKSMLAAKSIALTNPISAFCSSASGMLQTPVTSCSGLAQMSTQSGPFLSQPSMAPLTQMPPVIRAPVAGVVSAVPSAQQTAMVNQGAPRILQTPAPVGLQMQNLAVAGLPASVKSVSSPVDTQRVGVPSMVRMSLPAGLPVAGIQPQAIRLVPSSQAGSGSGANLQPVLAAVKPGVQGLQQLQLLAAAGGLQGLQLGGQPQVALKSGAAVGQAVAGQTVSMVNPSEEQKQAVQLCFTMQPGGQGGISTSASTVMPQTMVQGGAGLRGASAVPGFSAFGASPLSPCNSGPVSKVIMASPATSLPLPTSLQPGPVCSAVNQSPIMSLKSAENRLTLSVTPGTLKSQFIISPVSSQSYDASQALIRQHSAPADSVDGAALFTNSSSPQLQRAIKHNLSSTDILPIPAKKACLDMGGISSSAVLANLNQTITAINTAVSSSNALTTASVPNSSCDGGLPRVIMASSAADNSASCTLLNLAAHVSPGGALPAVVPSTVAAPSMPMPLLQQLGGMGPLMGRPQTATPPQKQQVLVRSIGGQLLTDNNIPVTENNGEYKVMPKATLQIGSKTVTVLSPSGAMIQNVRNPVSTNVVSAASHGQTPPPPLTSTPVPAASNIQAPAAGGTATGAPTQNQGIVRTILRPDMKPETVFSMYSQASLKHSPLSSHSDRTEAQPVGQDAVAGAVTAASPVMQEAQGVKQTVSVNNTPLLKARLEQPRLSQSAGLAGVSGPREAVNGVANSQPRVSSEGGGGVPSGEHKNTQQQQSSPASSGENSASKNLEEEAALNLLTLANQRVAL